jgi:adenylate cyclase
MSADEPAPPPVEEDAATAEWRAALTGTDPGLRTIRRWWRRVPSSPRCKMCAAPFRGIGSLATRAIMHGTSPSNPLLCSVCFHSLRKNPGGAEIEVSILFADIRGSTGIAERTSAAAFTQLVQRFYAGAASAIDHHGGIVDKFLGDGVMALFIPAIAGEAHAERAIAAGRAVLVAAQERALLEGGVFVGVGVHAGVAFVGAVGIDDNLDFTALGDAVNVAARLAAAAGAGELVVSATAWDSGSDATAVDRRSIEVKGRSAPLDVVVLTSEPATPA